jgi:lipoprotein-releasing system ATP-binding protein
MESEKKTPLLEAQDIRKAFYHTHCVQILDGIQLTVHPGESVAIIGRSGEGKSTLLQILGTLEEPCQGSLRIAGQTISTSNRNLIRNHSIGFVFQSFHLLEDYTALENVLMPARIARKNVRKGSEAEERCFYLLEKVGLADRAHFHTKLLSGGEKQRVALARALCNDPALIFADEPSGNLDRQTSDMIHELLLGCVQEQGKALIVVTHDRELARLCQTRHELRSGKLYPAN